MLQRARSERMLKPRLNVGKIFIQYFQRFGVLSSTASVTGKADCYKTNEKKVKKYIVLAELAIHLISYPTSVSGIIVLLKTIRKYCQILLIIISLCKNNQKTI